MKTEIIFPCIERWHCIDLLIKNIREATKPKNTQILIVASARNKFISYLQKNFEEIFDKVRIVKTNNSFVDHDKLRKHIRTKDDWYKKINRQKLKNVFNTYQCVVDNISNAEQFWFIEDDTLFPLDVYKTYTKTMRKFTASIVTGVSYYWHTFNRDRRNFWNLEFTPVFGHDDSSKEYRFNLTEMKPQEKGFVELGATGLGNVLTERKPVTTWIPKSYPEISSGADISFFENAIKRGFKAIGIWDTYLPHITKFENGDVGILGRIDKKLYKTLF